MSCDVVYRDFQGILGKVETDHGEVKKWKTYSLEFDQSFIEK